MRIDSSSAAQNDIYDLSLVIACYNEELILEKNVQEIIDILETSKFTYEIIFVDDCSKDRTREIMDKLIKKYRDKAFKGIFHKQNEGRGKAVTDGFMSAKGETAGFIDIDLEIHARYIPSFVLAIKNGYDVAVAHRIYTFQFKSIDRYLMSKGYIWLVRHLLGLPFKDTEAGLKFFNRKRLLPIIKEIQDPRWFWDTEFMTRAHLAGLKIKEILCVCITQSDRPSTVNKFSDTIYYFKQLWRLKECLVDESTKRDRN